MRACSVGGLAAAFSLAALPAFAAERTQSAVETARFRVPVSVLLGCFLDGQLLMTATPRGDDFVVRRKSDGSVILLIRELDRSRAELHRSATGASNALVNAMRTCEARYGV